MISIKELANLFDHTVLKADARECNFEKLCNESIQYGFKMVAINSAQVPLCKKLLNDSTVHVGAAIAFPLGQCTIKAKEFETIDAIKNGADEIDYVINISKLKDGYIDYIKDEMKSIVSVCRENNIISKVIFENCYLNEKEKKLLCEVALEVVPDFIKTSTGFGTYGAKIEDVMLMKQMVGSKIKVKAAGGIRDLSTALKMIEAGAERIGSSAGVAIIEEYKLLNK